MKRLVYSALIGGYERLLEQPAAPESDVEFILFTDADLADVSANWKTVRVEPRFINDSVRSARYLKIIGHPLLDEYDQTLWIDNRVILRDGFEKLFSKLDEFDIALPIHSFRGPLENEFESVLSMGFDDPQRVRELYLLARKAHIEASQTLWTGLLLRRRSAEVERCMRTWMDHLLLTSRRDQLSINLAIDISGISVNRFHLDNFESQYHTWTTTDLIQRNSRIQTWRNPSRSAALRISDRIRSLPHGYKIARGLAKLGLRLPTLPAS